MSDKKKNNEFGDIIKFLGLFILIPPFLFIQLVPFLTRYYPFSLLFRNNMYHYNNRHVKSLASLVESITKNMGKPFILESADRDQYFCTLIGKFRNTKKKISFDDILKSLSMKLKITDREVFIRDGIDGKTRIVVSSDALKSSASIS